MIMSIILHCVLLLLYLYSPALKGPKVGLGLWQILLHMPLRDWSRLRTELTCTMLGESPSSTIANFCL